MTRTVNPDGTIDLIADDGMMLENAEVFTKHTLIGLHGSESLWEEITEEEAARRRAQYDDPDIDDAEALDILLGGDGT